MTLVAALTTSGDPIGTVIVWPTSTVPAGFLELNGAAVSQTTYAALFALTGHTFGADPGGGNFLLPDLRDRLIVTRGVLALGATGGSKTHTLTIAQLPAHLHGGTLGPMSVSTHNHSGTTGTVAAHTHQIRMWIGTDSSHVQNGALLSTSKATLTNWNDVTYSATHNHLVTCDTVAYLDHTHFTGTAGGGGSHNNMMPYIGMKYVVRALP